MSDFFTSIEFYIAAFAIAIGIIAYFANSNDEQDAASSDIYSPTLLFGSEAASAPLVTLHSTEEGEIEVSRHGLLLPGQTSVYIKADFVKDHITLTERIAPAPQASNPTDAICSLHFTTRPRRRQKYYVRYEAPNATMWGVAYFANYGGYSTTITLKS